RQSRDGAWCWSAPGFSQSTTPRSGAAADGSRAPAAQRVPRGPAARARTRPTCFHEGGGGKLCAVAPADSLAADTRGGGGPPRPVASGGALVAGGSGGSAASGVQRVGSAGRRPAERNGPAGGDALRAGLAPGEGPFAGARRGWEAGEKETG